MSISVPCPACGKMLKAPPSMAGKKAQCPGCGKPLLVPVTTSEAVPIITPVAATMPAAAFGTISVPCPSCGKTLKAPASAAGKKAKCPACNAIMVVPEKILEAEAATIPKGIEAIALPSPHPVSNIYTDGDFAPSGSSSNT